MIKINCHKKWGNYINEKKLQEILKIFLRHIFEREIGISLYITDDSEIKKLNKKYRNKNTPTDILSWTYHGNDKFIFKNSGLTIAGEIVVSAERIQEQSKANGWSFSTELIRLLAHGCAHIAGLDHEHSEKDDKEMLELEIKLLKKIGITDIY